MRNTSGFITMAVVVGLSIGLAALAPQGTTTQTPPVVRITVTGCVEPAGQATAGDSRKADTTYVLTDAKSGQSGQATGTSGTASAQPSSTYRLNASDATLLPQVGHQVEIVAIIEEPGIPTLVGTSGSSQSTANAPKLKVEQIKMIAAACPQ
jgi:hypothetical protein